MSEFVRRLTVGLGLCALVAVSAAGCQSDAAEEAKATVELATPRPDLGPARDKDVAWIYHLSKTHATDDLVARLERDRARLTLDAIAASGSQPKNVFASEPPHSSAPVVSMSAPGSLATNPATPRPGDPLAAVPAQQLDPAIVLALYHIDPQTYRDLFVANYPTTPEGVQHDFGDRLASANLTKDGENYPIVALARIAATNDVALAKLYTAASVANDDVADRYATVIAAFTKGHPDALLPMLVRLEMPTRLATVSEPAGWCRIPPKGVLDSVPAEADELTLQRDLRSTLSRCAELDRRPVRHHDAARPANRERPSAARAPSR